MTTDPGHPDEPPQPPQGMTRDDIGATQAAAGGRPSTLNRMLVAMNPGVLLSTAESYPAGLKQFLQFCLILVYPAWVAGVALSMIVYAAVYSMLWVVFWPARAWMKKNRPDDYAASQRK